MRNQNLNCPFCVARGQSPDTTRNLSVREDGVYQCWRCHAKPSETGPLPTSLRPVCGPEYPARRGEAAGSEALTGEHDPTKCGACWEFLVGRGLHICQAPEWLTGGWCAGRSPDVHRLIFRDKITGRWQGRAVNPRSDLRYYSPPGGSEEGVAPMLLMQPSRWEPSPLRGHSTTVIVEGPTDGLTLWANGIPALVLFGKSYSDQKLERVQTELRGAPRVTLCLDRDGCDVDTAQWAWRLARFADVRVWPIEAADPGAMEPAELGRLRKAVRA